MGEQVDDAGNGDGGSTTPPSADDQGSGGAQARGNDGSGPGSGSGSGDPPAQDNGGAGGSPGSGDSPPPPQDDGGSGGSPPDDPPKSQGDGSSGDPPPPDAKSPASTPVPTLSVDNANVAVGAAFTLTWSIENWADGMTATLAPDGDAGDGTDPVALTPDANGAGTTQVTPKNPGTFNYTLTVTPEGRVAVPSSPVAVTVAAADAAAPVVTLSVDNASVAIGSPYTLTWSIQNWADGMAATLAPDGDAGDGTDPVTLTPDDKGAGTTQVTPKNAGDFTYTLSVQPKEGDAVTATAKVTVTAAAADAPVLSLAVDNASVAIGSPYTLTWSIQNWADGMAATLAPDGDAGDGTDPVTLTPDDKGAGTTQITPKNAGDFTYTLSVQPKDGDAVTATAKVTVTAGGAAAAITLAVDNASVAIGAPFTLTWSIQNWADGMTATLAPDNDAGDGTDPVTLTPDDKGGGTTQVTPKNAGDFTYTLSVQPKDGDAVTATAKVTVTGAATAITLTVDNATVGVGSQFTLTWSIQNWADGMTATLAPDNDAGDGTDPVTLKPDDKGAGTTQITPANAGDFVYTLIAQPQTGDAATATIKVTVSDGPTVVSFSADPDPDQPGHPPTELQLATGQSTKVKLSWKVANAKQVKIKTQPVAGGEATDLKAVDVGDDGTGSETVDPQDAEIAYVLVAADGDKESPVSTPINVHFGDGHSPIAQIDGPVSLSIIEDGKDPSNSTEIMAHEGVTLKWKVANAKTVTFKADIGPQPADLTNQLKEGNGEGSFSVLPMFNTVYSLTVEDKDGQTQVATVTVGVYNVVVEEMTYPDPDGGADKIAAAHKFVIDLKDGAVEGVCDARGGFKARVPVNAGRGPNPVRIIDQSGKEVWKGDVTFDVGEEIAPEYPELPEFAGEVKGLPEDQQLA